MDAKRSAFQWNAGAWFGTQLGATCWLLICSLLLIQHSVHVAGLVGGCFLLANVIGTGLWLGRTRIKAYQAFQILLGLGWLTSLAGLHTIESAGLWHVVSGISLEDVGGKVSAGTMKLVIWLVFPLMMGSFYALERSSRN